MSASPPTQRPSLLWRLLRWVARLFVLLLVIGGVGGWQAWLWFDREILSTLPAELARSTDFRIPCSVQVYDAGGLRVDEFYLERRVWVPIRELPEHVWRAFVAAEDRRFFAHRGVDPLGIGRALVVNLQGGSVRQGGSTITQQLVKNLLVGKEKSYRRKLREAVLAGRLDAELDKMELLELYINYIALGHGNYGVEAAAQDYFGISARELDVGQAAMIAGLVPAPSRYSPRNNPALAAQRREIVLKLMVSQSLISATEASLHLADPVLVPRNTGAGGGVGAAYLTETRREIRRVFGQDVPFLEGLQVYTPLDVRVQAVTEQALRDGLQALEARQGARGPVRNIPVDQRAAFLARGDGLKIDRQTSAFRDPRPGECFFALADDALGALSSGPFHFALRASELEVRVRVPDQAPSTLGAVLNAGDVLEVCIPAERPEGESPDRVIRRDRPWSEGSVVAIENATGHVVALAGGYDVGMEGLVRATQAKRQPGSSFKPFVYGAALVEGRRQTDIIVDSPFSLIGTNGLPWAPQNYDGKYFGAVPLRTAIALSLNTVAVRLAMETGVEKVASLARSLGVRSPLRQDLTVALGSSEVTPMDMAVSYASIARLGVRVDPVYITRVHDRTGRQIALSGEGISLPGAEGGTLPGLPGVQAMPAGEAYVLADMMRNVFLAGTAKRGQKAGMDYAGKTGTTSGFVDAWFVGYSPRYTVAVWVGTDGTVSIGERETGGKVSLPIWTAVMDALPNIPEERFAVPEGVSLLPVEDKWLGFVRGNMPPDSPQIPEFDDREPLPPFGFEPPLAKPPPAPPLSPDGELPVGEAG